MSFYAVAIILVSLLILLQDLRSRMVMVILFPLLGIAGLVWSLSNIDWVEIIINTSINLLLLSIQILVVLCYFLFVRKKRNLQELIGFGDLFFMIACSFLFSPFNFMLFCFVSMVFSLALHFLALKIPSYTSTNRSIPLAGWQAAFLIISVVISTLFKYNLFTDHMVLNGIYSYL